MMDSSELQVGDLIFTFNSMRESEHVSFYVGHKDGSPYVLHAVSAPYNAIMITRLAEADEGCAYRIIRPRDTELSRQVKHILLGWVEFKVPFASTKKRDAIYNRIDDLGGLDTPRSGEIQEAYGKATYASNYVSYFLMAHYLPYIPVVYTDELKIEGLRCSEAIIAAFNIALLMRHAILEHRQWTLPEGITISTFLESLENPLPFDSQSTLPTGFYKHCVETPTHWIDCGVMNLLPSPPIDLSSKEMWREFRDSLEEVALENTALFLQSAKPSPTDKSPQCMFFSSLPGSLKEASVSPARARSLSRLTSSPYFEAFFTHDGRKNSFDYDPEVFELKVINPSNTKTPGPN